MYINIKQAIVTKKCFLQHTISHRHTFSIQRLKVESIEASFLLVSSEESLLELAEKASQFGVNSEISQKELLSLFLDASFTFCTEESEFDIVRWNKVKTSYRKIPLLVD